MENRILTGEGIEIGGNGCIHGDLLVEGWLDTRNIRGFLRGLYPTVESLMKSCPQPLAGWAALVGKSLPAEVYVSADGRWESTGELGGSPIVRDTFGSAIYPALSEERGLRELADEELWIAFSESGGFRRPEMCWEFGEYLSQSNRLIKKEGYRRSELFQLFPGEEIVIECETGGEVMPIGVEAKDQASGWYDFPAIGDVRNRGMRTYRYFSDDGDNIMVSCVGEPERVLIYRPKDSLRLNKLYTAMGGVASGTRRQNGGKLLPDGSVSNVAGFGTTHRIRRGMLRMVHYQGYMSQGEGEQRVMILFLGASGEILSGHGVGVSTGGNDSIVEHEAGSQDIWCAVPEQCERMLFCHEFVAGAPRFLVTGF